MLADSATLPPWRTGWGEDEYGLFVESSVSNGDRYWQYVDIRWRWIPAGTFMMGSLENEAGRYDDEGPQHKVTLTHGYWMMEVPVNQALWQAVMENNPSQFLAPDRPVEKVSWDDCSEFCKRLSASMDIDCQLPTEAQWEYACRAGTNEATYAGDLDILGDNNAPLLNEIAWYGGNSGVEFDLPKHGIDSSDWQEKQFEHKLAGTRKLREKRANDWGLFDMLGNVWEWCADGRRAYTDTAERNPVGSTESFTPVVRGGSWHYYARLVRSACRYEDHRETRSDSLGFRCVCSAESGPSGVSAAGATRDE